MPRWLYPLDLTKQELRNAVIQNLASAPSSPTAGLVYYDTALNQLGVYNGTSWTYAGTGGVTSLAATSPVQVDASTGAITISILAASGSNAGSMSSAHYTLLAGATNSNTNSTIVKRDGSGNFSANVITAATVTGLSAPTNSNDAATKGYVDATSQGLSIKQSVRMATTAALPSNTYSAGVLTATANGALSAIDGMTPVLGDRILVKNEATAANNGIYSVTQVGDGTHPYILTRSSDANSSTNLTDGMFTFVAEGTANGGAGYVLAGTGGSVTVGTTALNFTQFSGAGELTAGTGITISGNAVSISTGYTGQTSITTLGTVTTGTWSATTIAVNKGGTGSTTAAGARSNLGATGKYTATIGDGSTTSIVVNHALGTQDVVVVVYNASSPYDVQYPDIRLTDANNVTLVFGSAPSSNSLKVVVVG